MTKTQNSKHKEFNIVIVGTGGQGLITLLKILAEAALIENYDLKTSELHGLSQRGGSVEVHIRFGPSASLRTSKKIFSPLVSQAGADLILALEFQEALNSLYYASSKTKFLINKYFLPIPGKAIISQNEILNQLKKFTKKIEVVEAADICKKELGKEVFAGVYLLSYGSNKNLIPLKSESILKAIKKQIPEKYLELNLKAFELAKSS